MDEEYQVIDDPNDPRLQNTPLNPTDDSSGFDPQAFISGKDTATAPPPEQPQGLPTITPSLSTFYYPASPEETRARGLSYRMEGGTQGGGKFGDVHLPNHTIERYLSGESPFVAVAMKGPPTGDEFMTTILGHTVLAKNVDTGGGLKDGQMDFATSNPDLARSGVEHGPFDPQAFIKRQDLKAPGATVPDINAFMEPAPTDTPEEATAEEPSAGEIVGKAISKAASKYGEALANRPIPKFETPQSQLVPIPQVPAPQTQVISGQGMIGAAIPTAQLPQAQPLPSPVPTPPLTGPGLHNFALSRLAPEIGGEVSGMVNAPIELAHQAMNPQLSIPARLAATIGVVASAAQLDPLVPHGGISSKAAVTSTREVPVPEAMQPKPTGINPPDVFTPNKQQGLPVKAASVQGLKNPPAIHQMRADVVNLKSQGRHAEAKALQGQINQLEGLSVGEQPPTPPGQPPTQEPPPVPPVQSELEPTGELNPVPGSGKFIRSYRVDKELGNMMEGIGASRESGALQAELRSRNLLHELTPQQEADLGTLLVSERLKTVNPQHPQVIMDSVSRGILSDPAIAKAYKYLKDEIQPEIEGLRKRAGLSQAAIAKNPAYTVSLIPATEEMLPPTPGAMPKTAKLSRTTRFAKRAEGQAAQYNTNVRDILRESYIEATRKARIADFYKATETKGITENGTYEELPPELQHDLTAATQPALNQLPIQLNPNFGLRQTIWDLTKRAGRGARSMFTGAALTANPVEMQSHIRRQLAIVASKPPIGMGVMARLEALVPYFGPRLGAFKRAVMEDMSTPTNQKILQDIFDAGGGSSRSFGEQYTSGIPGLSHIQKASHAVLFKIPKGKGMMGWDLRMRVQLEKIRRAAEGNMDPQRIREFSNQIGQYGSNKDWFVAGLSKINPYAATSVPMRITELKTAVGTSGLKSGGVAASLGRRGETLLRGTGGTLLAIASANYALSGKWPWQNDKGHEFDINMGVKDKEGKTIYMKLRAVAPELARPISTASIPDIMRETKAKHPQYLAAGMTGPVNQALSLISGPAQNFALTAATGKVPYFLKRPGEGVELMDIARLKVGESRQGASKGLRQLKVAAQGINPIGGIFGDQHSVEVPGLLGYMEEPIPGIKPFGEIFTTSYEKKSSSGYSRGSGRSSGRGSGGRGGGRGTGGR